jgi:hypothetical protein
MKRSRSNDSVKTFPRINPHPLSYQTFRSPYDCLLVRACARDESFDMTRNRKALALPCISRRSVDSPRKICLDFGKVQTPSGQSAERNLVVSIATCFPLPWSHYARFLAARVPGVFLTPLRNVRHEQRTFAAVGVPRNRRAHQHGRVAGVREHRACYASSLCPGELPYPDRGRLRIARFGFSGSVEVSSAGRWTDSCLWCHSPQPARESPCGGAQRQFHLLVPVEALDLIRRRVPA